MTLPKINIQPLQIRVTEEEILADLAYPARPSDATGRREGGR